MEKQLTYKEVQIGTELPLLVKHPTTRQEVMWVVATEEYYEIHYDKDFALSQGLPGVLIHGTLTSSFLSQLITDWMGEQGTLKKFNFQFRGMHFPGEDITCKGKVTKKYIQNNEHYVECEMWTENPEGERTTTGRAVVSLPD